MKKYLLLGASLALASCASTKLLPHYSEAQKQAQRQDITYWQPEPAKPDTAGHTKPPIAIALPPIAAPDSLPYVAVARKPTFIDKLLKRTPKTTYYPGTMPVRAGKKSVINIYHGTATVTTTTVGKKATAATAAGATATSVEKIKAPTAIGDSTSATDNTKAGQKGGAAAIGKDASATATTIKPPTPWLKYGLWAAGALGGYWLVFGGGALWVAGVFKRKNNQA
jgi:hypothetical protein